MKDHDEMMIEELMLHFERAVRNEKPREPVFHCFYREHHPNHDVYEIVVIHAPTKEIARLFLFNELTERARKKGYDVFIKEDSSSVIGLYPHKNTVAFLYDHFHFIGEV